MVIIMGFYHGTTTAFGKLGIILPPDETGVEREIRSKKITNMVYITPSSLSAARYAKKAADKFGGEPIIYKVKPMGRYYSLINNEWVTDRARVIGIEEFKRTEVKVK